MAHPERTYLGLTADGMRAWLSGHGIEMGHVKAVQVRFETSPHPRDGRSVAWLAWLDVDLCRNAEGEQIVGHQSLPLGSWPALVSL